MRLPWGFYADILTLVFCGAGILIGIVTGSLPIITYNTAWGFFATWHLTEIYKKLSLNKLNETEEKK